MAYTDEVYRFSPLLYYQLADTAGSYASIVSADGPVAYWRLEETSGTTAEDSTANNHDLTLANTPTLDVDGVVDGENGMTFTGSSSEYGYVADHADFAWGTACSFEGWIKTTSTASNQVIVSQWNADYAFWLGFESAGQATFRVRIASTNYTAQVSGGWNDGLWHHVVGVRDGTQIRLYVDGKVVARTAVAAGSLDSSTSNVDVGRVAGSAYLTGSLDEVAVYTKVLTAAEILEHYEAASVSAVDTMNVAGGAYEGFPTLNQTGPFTGAVAVDFDGTDDYLTGSVSIDTASDFTIAGWVNIDALASSRQPFSLASLANNNYRYGLEITSTGTLRPYYYNTSGTKVSATPSTLKISAGMWYYVALVKSSTTLYCYVNGVEYANTVFVSNRTWSGTTALNVGSGVAGGSTSREEFWDGKLCEVALFDAALTANQQAWLWWPFVGGLDSYEDQVVDDGADILWMLDDASGTTMVDAANSYDGTYVNTPTLAQAGPHADLSAATFVASSTEYAYYNDSGALHLDGDGTVECWFKTSSTSTNITFFNRWVADYEFFLGINTTAGLVRFFARKGGTSYIAQSVASTWNDGAWHHAVGVRSGGYIYLYLDGVLQQATSTPTGTLDGGTSNLMVATFGGTFYSDVSLSGVALYKGTALTPLQVQKHYLTKTAKDTGLSYYHQLVLATRPTLYYRLGDASGTVAKDETGTQHGVYTNTPTLGATSLVAADTDDDAVTFASASSEYIDIADNAAMDIAAYSLEAWIDTATSGSGVYQGIITRDISSGTRHFQLRVSNTVLEFIAFNTTPGATTLTTTHAVTDGKPHHVVATLSGTTMTVYCDGIAQTSTLSGTPASGGTVSMLVGANRNNSDVKEHFFNGTIDEVAFYNRALTAAEVDEHFVVGSEIRRLNPSDKGSNCTLSNQSRTTSHTASAWDHVRSETPLLSGKYYWEVYIDNTGTSGGSATLVVGICTPEFAMASSNPSVTNNCLAYADNGNESVGWGTYGNAWADGDIISVLFDADAGDLTFWRNGVSQGTMYTGKSTLTTYFPFIGHYGTSSATINLGDDAFTYTPTSGYAAPAWSREPVTATQKHMSRLHSDFKAFDAGKTLYKTGGSGAFRSAMGSGIARSSGKYYFEYHSIDADTTAIGVTKRPEGLAVSAATLGTGDAYVYWNSNGYKSNGDGTSGASYGDTWNRHKIGVAVDFDAGKIWFAKDNTWQASGDPAAGTNEAYATIFGSFLPFVCHGGLYNQIGTFVFNEASLAYTPPSGFSPWGDVSTVILTVADALHALISGDPLAPAEVELLVADALHALASLNVSMDLPLDLANAIHDLVGENVTMDIALATAWGTHSHAAQVMVLDQLHNLLVRAASHAHRATSSSFIQAHLLATQNAEHSYSDSSPTFDLPLTIDGAGHSSSSSSPAWTQVHVLTGMGGWHRVSTAAFQLTPGLVVASAGHVHTAEEVTLLEAVFIQAASAVHSQLAQVGSVFPELVIAPGAHALDSTGALEVWLAAQAGSHAQSAQNVETVQNTRLSVASAAHGASSEAASYTITGDVLVVASCEHLCWSNGILTPKARFESYERVYFVEPEVAKHL